MTIDTAMVERIKTVEKKVKQYKVQDVKFQADQLDQEAVVSTLETVLSDEYINEIRELRKEQERMNAPSA